MPIRQAIITITLSLLLLFCLPAQAKKITGLDIADSVTAGEKTLVLNGGGARTKFVVKVYVAGLYLGQKSTDARAIVEADEAMAIRIYVTSKLLSAKRLKKALNKGFKKSTNGNTTAIQTGIDKLQALLSKDVRKGNNFSLVYVPGQGTLVYNDQKLLDTITGLEFKQALFGIWLSDRPAQGSLKSDMLGS